MHLCLLTLPRHQVQWCPFPYPSTSLLHRWIPTLAGLTWVIALLTLASQLAYTTNVPALETVLRLLGLTRVTGARGLFQVPLCWMCWCMQHVFLQASRAVCRYGSSVWSLVMSCRVNPNPWASRVRRSFLAPQATAPIVLTLTASWLQLKSLNALQSSMVCGGVNPTRHLVSA